MNRYLAYSISPNLIVWLACEGEGETHDKTPGETQSSFIFMLKNKTVGYVGFELPTSMLNKMLWPKTASGLHLLADSVHEK